MANIYQQNTYQSAYRKHRLLRLFYKKLYSSGKTQAYTQALHQLKFKTMAYPHGPATLLSSRLGLSAGCELLLKSLDLEECSLSWSQMTPSVFSSVP